MESLSRDALCAYLVSQGLDADLANKLYGKRSNFVTQHFASCNFNVVATLFVPFDRFR